MPQPQGTATTCMSPLSFPCHPTRPATCQGLGSPGHERGAEAVGPGHAVQLVRAQVRHARQLQHLLPERRQQVRLRPSSSSLG